MCQILANSRHDRFINIIENHEKKQSDKVERIIIKKKVKKRRRFKLTKKCLNDVCSELKHKD